MTMSCISTSKFMFYKSTNGLNFKNVENVFK